MDTRCFCIKMCVFKRKHRSLSGSLSCSTEQGKVQPLHWGYSWSRGSAPSPDTGAVGNTVVSLSSDANSLISNVFFLSITVFTVRQASFILVLLAVAFSLTDSVWLCGYNISEKQSGCTFFPRIFCTTFQTQFFACVKYSLLRFWKICKFYVHLSWNLKLYCYWGQLTSVFFLFPFVFLMGSRAPHVKWPPGCLRLPQCLLEKKAFFIDELHLCLHSSFSSYVSDVWFSLHRHKSVN